MEIVVKNILFTNFFKKFVNRFNMNLKYLKK